MNINVKEIVDRYDAALNAMVDKFIQWQLPKDFSPDCGISFDGRKDDEWNKNKTWPTGTNLLTAEQAKQMFKTCVPPVCFGLDDCSSQALSVCKFADKCGEEANKDV